ncbi:MAG: hypothetical protein AAF602_16235 [Myxococcota bacterium]
MDDRIPPLEGSLRTTNEPVARREAVRPRPRPTMPGTLPHIRNGQGQTLHDILDPLREAAREALHRAPSREAAGPTVGHALRDTLSENGFDVGQIARALKSGPYARRAATTAPAPVGLETEEFEIEIEVEGGASFTLRLRLGGGWPIPETEPSSEQAVESAHAILDAFLKHLEPGSVVSAKA